MTVPYNYQIKGARALHRFKGRALLADDMGLGKSLTTSLYLNRHPELEPIVIVCPASLKYNWEKELYTHFGWHCEILDGTRPLPVGMTTPHRITVINYDILGPWMKWLKRLDPLCIVLDESQYIMNPKAKRTKAVQELCRGVPHVVALSGTPASNKPIELWPTLNILRPDLFPSRWKFGHRYCGAKMSPFGWNFDGATNTQELHEILVDNLMIRRTKEEVLSELPAKRRIVIPFELQDRREYDKAVKDYLGWVMQHDPSRLQGAIRAQALTKITTLKGLAGKLKLPSVFEWVDDFLNSNPKEKIVLFGVHRDIVEAIYSRYQRTAVKIHGGTSLSDRTLAVESFQKNPRIRVFIGNIKAAGVGITLTAAATMAFVEMGWTPGEHTQAEDRIHRIGQLESAACYYLVARNTIETKLAAIIQTKQEVLSNTLDGGSREGDLDVLDLLNEELLKDQVGVKT